MYICYEHFIYVSHIAVSGYGTLHVLLKIGLVWPSISQVIRLQNVIFLKHPVLFLQAEYSLINLTPASTSIRSHSHSHSHAYLNTCTHTHTHICIKIWTHAHTHMQINAHLRTHIYIYIYIVIWTGRHTHTHIHTEWHIQSHTHINIYTCKHTYMWNLSVIYISIDLSVKFEQIH